MSLNGSLVGVTSHITPLPAGEGLGEGPPPHGLEMCAKMLSELCGLCERKNSPASLKNVLFLTEKHRRTEHTVFHRDIKSTDFTEPYSHRGLTPPASLLSRTCPSPFKNMPFSIREHALQRPRTRPSWCLTRPFFNAVCNLLISCRLQRWMKHTYWMEI